MSREHRSLAGPEGRKLTGRSVHRVAALSRQIEYEASAGPWREYTIDAVFGERSEKVYGTACRQVDGSRRVQG